MKMYPCQVEKTDNLVCYVSGQSAGYVEPLFAVVAVDKNDRKVSVLLSKASASALHDQLGEFLVGNVLDD